MAWIVRTGIEMRVNKVTWERVGRVTQPGRYMYTFGWLTITEADIQIWQTYPDAAFTLLARASTDDAVGDEFHLGVFDVSPTSSPPVREDDTER